MIGVKLKTNIQKRTDADVKIIMRRGVKGRKPNTMMIVKFARQKTTL